MIEWKDATNYSHGERGRIEPNSWECRIEGIRVWVSKGHTYYPNEWIMHCGELGLREKRIGPSFVMSANDAQCEALKIAAKAAANKAATYVVFATTAESFTND